MHALAIARMGDKIIYFPAALSSTATLLWLLRCYLNELTKANYLNKGVLFKI